MWFREVLSVKAHYFVIPDDRVEGKRDIFERKRGTFEIHYCLNLSWM